ncbi:MAG: TetR/AcrR family transcriptional regulator [Sphingorhabdus sp.]
MADADTRDSYHHGNLAEALIAAAINSIDEHGYEQLSMRELAKQVGVSPGAPFRHFKNKTALMTAIAEQAMARFLKSVFDAVAKADPDDPIAGLEAIGQGYVDWALENPIHFRIISTRTIIDFAASPKLQADNDAVRDLMIKFFEAGLQSGRIAPDLSLETMLLAGRGLAYGLARMWSDGHFPEWHVKGEPRAKMQAAIRMFIQSLQRR